MDRQRGWAHVAVLGGGIGGDDSWGSAATDPPLSFGGSSRPPAEGLPPPPDPPDKSRSGRQPQRRSWGNAKRGTPKTRLPHTCGFSGAPLSFLGHLHPTGGALSCAMIMIKYLCSGATLQSPAVEGVRGLGSNCRHRRPTTYEFYCQTSGGFRGSLLMLARPAEVVSV